MILANAHKMNTKTQDFNVHADILAFRLLSIVQSLSTVAVRLGTILLGLCKVNSVKVPRCRTSVSRKDNGRCIPRTGLKSLEAGAARMYDALYYLRKQEAELRCEFLAAERSVHS